MRTICTWVCWMVLGLGGLSMSGCGGGSGGATTANDNHPSGLTPEPTNPANYTAELTLDANPTTIAYKDLATLTLTNSGSTSAIASLTVTMPSGFKTTGFVAACGAQWGNSDATHLVVTNATIPAGGNCVLTVTLLTPDVINLPSDNARTFTIASAPASGVATLSSWNAPTVSFLGATPGMNVETDFPSTVVGVSRLDMTITPQNDPGPDSNVFYSNQMDSIGYTGMQTPQVPDPIEGQGKLFLFSIWSATDAETGTPPGGTPDAPNPKFGGSFCTVGAGATDGQSGVQCRFRYEWQVNHTYRFSVTPNTALGAGWYTDTVTDVTGGVNGDSFVIGHIKYGASVLIPASYIVQFTEFYDWNDERTRCDATPYTVETYSVSAWDAFGQPITLKTPGFNTNDICPSDLVQYVGKGAGLAQLLGGVSQSVRGFLKTNNQCLQTQNGLTDSTAAVSNNLKLDACPSQAQVEANGGEAFPGLFWVLAGDGSLVTIDGHCASAANTSVNGSVVNLATCQNGANQQWIIRQNGNTQQLMLANTTFCMANDSNNVVLRPCASDTTSWVLPGTTFSY